MNLGGQAPWQVWAALSALFAALTAIFAKIGVENVNSDLATLIRTLVVFCVLAMIVFATGQFQDPAKISGRTYLFLLLSGLGTGASWLCYFRALKLGNAAQVAPIDKLSVVMVAILGVVFLGEKLSAVNWFGILLVAGERSWWRCLRVRSRRPAGLDLIGGEIKDVSRAQRSTKRSDVVRRRPGKRLLSAGDAPYPFAFSDENSSHASFGLAFLCTTALMAAIIAFGASD